MLLPYLSFPIILYMGVPGDPMVKNPPANAGDEGLIPGLGRSPREENGNPLQDSCLGNPMDRGTWQATVQRVTESQTRLSNQHLKFLSLFVPLPLEPKWIGRASQLTSGLNTKQQSRASHPAHLQSGQLWGPAWEEMDFCEVKQSWHMYPAKHQLSQGWFLLPELFGEWESSHPSPILSWVP